MSENLIASSSIVIDAPPDKVWRALTDPKTIKKYYFGTRVTSDWEPGSPIIWKGVHEGRKYRDHGTILDVRPGELLIHTHFNEKSGREDIPENYHTLTYTLDGTGDRTEVTLTQDNNHSYEEVNYSEKNWRTVLEGLKKVVES